MSKRRSIVNASISTWNSTFGKEETLQYPPHLEQVLRKLQGVVVELSLPSMQPGSEHGVSTFVEALSFSLTKPQGDDIPFYDSDTSIEDVKTTFKSLRVKESPFKITKSARKSMSRSPAVPTPGSKRVSARRTPKVRLRHDNSQIQFEPIVSSPSNPFNQESQILTERQKEMIDRQRLSTGLFANMGATSPQPEPRSPMELHSDALSTDDLVNHASRTTPSRALASMGPMDVFLGSSPTPHARKSVRHIDSNPSSAASPTAVRTVQFTGNDDLGSSPPRFEKESHSTSEQNMEDVQVGSSFDYRQPESSHSDVFDDGTTIDEEAFLAAEFENGRALDSDLPDDTIMSELPSSTIDLQLTAQIDADMQAHNVDLAKPKQDRPESNPEFVDAASQQLPSHEGLEAAGSETEEDESTYLGHEIAAEAKDLGDTSSTSRVGDSFTKSSPTKVTPGSKRLRRSSRHSATPSPAHSARGQQRKQRGSNQKKKQEQAVEGSSTQERPEPVDDVEALEVVVDRPKHAEKEAVKQHKGKKRKSMSNTTSPDQSHVIVPETRRKHGLRRSQSLLSQVENSQDIIIEDTPAPKRARQSIGQDVSEAKNTPPTSTDAQTSQTKRLSHVQVTPKHSERGATRKASMIAKATAANAPAGEASAAAPPTIVEPDAAHTDPSDSQQAPTEASTPSRSFTERVILTPRSIINQLKSLKDYLFSAPPLRFGREEEREIDDALFDIRRQVIASGLRAEAQDAE